MQSEIRKLEEENRVLNQANKALSQKNSLLLESNVSNLKDLQLKLDKVEEEKRLIERERDDNDEALVELKQKLVVSEKLKNWKEDNLKDPTSNKAMLEKALKKLNLKEKDLEEARTKIKEQKEDISYAAKKKRRIDPGDCEAVRKKIRGGCEGS